MLFNLSNIFPISLATEIQWTRWLYDRSSPARIFQRLELKQNRGNPGWGSMRREKKFIPPLCTIFDIDRAKTRRKDPRKNGRNDPPLFFQKLLSKWKTRSEKKGRKRGPLDLTNARLIDHRLRYIVPFGRTNKPSSSSAGKRDGGG